MFSLFFCMPWFDRFVPSSLLVVGGVLFCILICAK